MSSAAASRPCHFISRSDSTVGQPSRSLMPPSPSPPSKASPDDNGSRLSEAALRKKKNADAQAAFRARRANYIATLEQTGSTLSVTSLPDACSSLFSAI